MPVDPAHIKVGFQELDSRAPNAYTRINYDDVLLAHRSQEMLRDNLNALEYHLSGEEDPQKTLAKASRNFNEMTELLNRIWNVIPPSVHTSIRSGRKALEAFGITELLERILVHLEAPDILRSMLVQRCWRDTIIGSAELKRALGLLPLDRDIFYTAFNAEFLWNGNDNGRVEPHDLFRADISNFLTQSVRSYERTCMAIYREISRDARMTTAYMGMKIFMCGKYSRPPHLGSRIASMLICHPPVKQLQVEIFCKHCKLVDENFNTAQRQPPFQISSCSEIGFTMGEIVEKTHHLRAVHRDCSSRFNDCNSQHSPNRINYTAMTSIPWEPRAVL